MCHQGILRAHSNGFFTTTGIAKDLWARQEQLSAADATHSKTFLLMTLSGKGTDMVVIAQNPLQQEWGNFPFCKLKRDLLRTSVRACTIHKNTFSVPFGFFYVKTEI